MRYDALHLRAHSFLGPNKKADIYRLAFDFKTTVVVVLDSIPFPIHNHYPPVTSTPDADLDGSHSTRSGEGGAMYKSLCVFRRRGIRPTA